MNVVSCNNTADWHAHHAMKAYRKKDYDAYRRHIVQADYLRYLATELVRWSGR